MTRSGLASTSPGIFGYGILPRLFVAVAVVVVLWAAMAWAVSPPAHDQVGHAAGTAAAARAPAASGA